MTVAKSILLFVVAAVFEIGGAWLVWQGVREGRGFSANVIRGDFTGRIGDHATRREQ